MSSRRDHEDLLAGAWPAATPPSRDDIRDELADHLECSAAELEAEGLGTQQAEERARAAFGDVEAVARQLYWLHHGRRIMLQRMVLGGLAGVCVILAIVMFVTYRQSVATAGAVASLQATVGQANAVDVPVRVVVSSAEGRPLAGREVYIWPRRIETPPFALPTKGLLWQIPARRQEQLEIKIPPAYELYVADEEGAVNLGRRPAGAYTVAVSMEPELLAGEWIDDVERRRGRAGEATVMQSWVGYAQQTFEVPVTREAVSVAVRLPTLKRARVPFVAPPGVHGRLHDHNNLWFVIRGDGEGMRAWLRALVNAPDFEDGVSTVELPLPERAHLYIGYAQWRAVYDPRHKEAGTTMGVVVEADFMPPDAGDCAAVQLPAAPELSSRPASVSPPP